MSTVPAVLAALVALGEATFAGDEWQTIDGPATAASMELPRVLAVGHEEFTVTSEPDSIGNSLAERYTVPMILSVALPGPDSLTLARDEVFAAYADISDALLNSGNRNLGLGAQLVIDAQPGSEQTYQPFATENGRSVALRFGVSIYAQLA